MSADRRPLLVVDADAAIGTALVDRFDVIARDWRLLAPPLLWSETCSVLHREISRSGRSPSEQRVLFDRIRRAPMQRVELRDPAEAWDIADVLGWSRTYDAEYLAVARGHGAGLFSVDRSLRNGAQRLGIELVAPA